MRTDHQALVWPYRLKELSGKIARWIEVLSHYDFGIEFRPGRKQDHCDALSGRDNPCDCETLASPSSVVPVRNTPKELGL